jgi:type I restriction enzyme M protein
MYLTGESVPGELEIITNLQAQEADYNLSPSRWAQEKDSTQTKSIAVLVRELLDLERESATSAATLARLLEKVNDDA